VIADATALGRRGARELLVEQLELERDLSDLRHGGGCQPAPVVAIGVP
jgi:hypothetical protein